MLREALALLAALSMLPVASATHWTYDTPTDAGYVASSGCWWLETGTPECLVGYACTAGAPQQAVDLALHCAGRASAQADDLALWAPRFAWWQAEGWANFLERQPATVNGLTQDQRDVLNAFLCATVWSFFCTNPVALPRDAPIDDPVGAPPV